MLYLSPFFFLRGQSWMLLDAMARDALAPNFSLIFFFEGAGLDAARRDGT